MACKTDEPTTRNAVRGAMTSTFGGGVSATSTGGNSRSSGSGSERVRPPSR